MPTITKKEIQKLIAKNRITLLFEAFSELGEQFGDKRFSKDIIVLQAKYTGLREAERIRTIRYDDKIITESQIINSLTEIVSDIPEHPYEISEQLYLKINGQNRSRFFLYLVLALSLIMLIGAAIFFTHDPAPPFNTIQDQPSVNTLPSSNPAIAIDTPQVIKPVVPLYIKALQISDQNSQMVTGKDTIPLAYMDFAYREGREQEVNRLTDACYFQFDLENPSRESIILQRLFVEVFQYKPIPATAKQIQIQPFEEQTVVYIHMGKSTKTGANIYSNSFYMVDGKKKAWGKIKIKPSGSEQVAVRINAKEPGIYTFQLGVEYYSAQNDSLVRKYVLPRKTIWAFKKRPE